jgi:hypothetical protein
MPTEDYSHMMMESEHMVVGDDIGDDGGGEDLKIPLSGMESRTNLTPRNEDCGCGGVIFCKRVHPPGYLGFSGIYGGMPKERPR